MHNYPRGKPPSYELTSEETMQFVAREVEAKNKKISKRDEIC